MRWGLKMGWGGWGVVKRSKRLVQTHRRQSWEQDCGPPLPSACGDPGGHTAAVSQRPCTPPAAMAASQGTLQRWGDVNHTDTSSVRTTVSLIEKSVVSVQPGCWDIVPNWKALGWIKGKYYVEVEHSMTCRHIEIFTYTCTHPVWLNFAMIVSFAESSSHI